MRHMQPDSNASWYAALHRECKQVFYTACYHCRYHSCTDMAMDEREQMLRLMLMSFAFK
jgi:hypothetical protein